MHGHYFWAEWGRREKERKNGIVRDRVERIKGEREREKKKTDIEHRGISRTSDCS